MGIEPSRRLHGPGFLSRPTSIDGRAKQQPSAYSGLISQISVSTDTRSYRPLSLRSCQITCQYRLSPRHGRALIFEPSIRHPSLNPDSEYRIAFDPRSAPRRPPTGQRADRRQHHRGADHRRRIARFEPIEQRCDELRRPHAHTEANQHTESDKYGILVARTQRQVDCATDRVAFGQESADLRLDRFDGRAVKNADRYVESLESRLNQCPESAGSTSGAQAKSPPQSEWRWRHSVAVAGCNASRHRPPTPPYLA